MTGLDPTIYSSNKKHITKGGESGEKIYEFARNLSCDSLTRIHDRYWPDFLFFQYDMNDIMEWGDSGRGCKLKGLEVRKK